MKDERSCPDWYWVRGLHDAQILEVSMQDDTLTLCIDSGNAMFDNTLERITFLGARPKTSLPEPTKKQPVYWLSDELIALAGLDRAIFPEAHESIELAGTVTRAAAEKKQGAGTDRH